MVRKLTDQGLDRGDRTLLRHIAEHRWSVTCVPPEDGCPGWAFTTGLYHEFSVPEIVVVGLARDVAHRMLNDIGNRCKTGNQPREGDVVGGLLEGVDCQFRTVQRCWYEPFVGRSLWFYEGNDFPLLQCVMPDKANRFPWEDAFEPSWREIQPWLWADDLAVAATGEHWRQWMSDAERSGTWVTE